MAETVCMQMYVEIYGIVVGDIYLNDKTMKKFDALGEKYRQLEKEQMKKMYDHAMLAILDGNGHGQTFDEYYKVTFKSE